MWVTKGCLTRRSPSHFLAMSAVPQARLTFFCTFTAGQTLLQDGVMQKALLASIGLIFTASTTAQEAAAPPAAPSTLISIYSSARFDDFEAAALMKGTVKQIPGMAIIQQRRTFEL